MYSRSIRSCSNQDVDQAVDEREVRPRLERQVQVGQHRRLRDARIDDDQRLAGVGLEPLPQDRMVVGDVGADEQDDVGALEVFVGAGRAVAAERALVAGDRRGHAQRGVAVVVARAEAELHQLAERVELFGDELAGADDADRLRAVRRLHVAEPADHRLDRDVPAHTLQRRVRRCPRLAASPVADEAAGYRARVGAWMVSCSESPFGQSAPLLTG